MKYRFATERDLAVVEGTLEQDIAPIGTARHPTIEIEDVWEQFRLYHDRRTSFKDFLISFKRADYSDFWALKGVSLNIEQGDVFGIIGENGSGKSTLLKCIAGILVPTRGTISIQGKISPLIELGAGFQGDLTGRENIYLNSAILGLSRTEIREREQEIIDFAELEKFIDSPLKNYSSGMKVRLGFAVAINVDPDVLLIDEVLAVGDQSFKTKCFEKLDEFKRALKTIVLVSHSLDQVRNLCNKAAWLEKGELQAIGDVVQVTDAYKASVKAKREAQMEKPDSETKKKKLPAAKTDDDADPGEVEITSLRLCGADRESKQSFETGEPITLEIKYCAKQKIKDFSFDFTILNSANTRCAHRTSGQTLEHIDGCGTLEFSADELNLLPGSYHLSVAARPKAGSETYYDHRQKCCPFEIVPSEKTSQLSGIAYIPGNWTHRVD